MNQQQTIRIPFQANVSRSDADLAVHHLALEQNPVSLKGSKIVLDLSKCRSIEVGAGWMIGNCLRRYQRHLEIVAFVPDPPQNFSGNWFKSFTMSGLGFSIAQYATSIIAPGGDVTQKIRSYYSQGKAKTPPVLAKHLTKYLWESPNHIMINGIHKGIIESDNEVLFSAIISELLPRVHIDRKFRSEWIEATLRFLFESTQNVYDHAMKRPLDSTENIMSYFSLRHHYYVREQKSMYNEFEQYITDLKNSRIQVKKGEFIEIVVNDDGVGIPARQIQSTGIYWDDDFEKERSVLLSALTLGGSSKLETHDSIVRGKPGFGMKKMRTSICSVNAFGLLRTGRCAVFLNPFISQYFVASSDARGYMPGTTWQVVVPVPEST